MLLVHMVGGINAVGGGKRAEHFGRKLEIDHFGDLVGLKTEFPPRNAHHDRVPLAAVSVTKHRGLEILVKGIVGRSAERVETVGEKLLLFHNDAPILSKRAFLKKGGRITPAAAALGTVLNLKPVLTIQGAKLDAYTKVRGMKLARKAMIDAMKKDLDTRFAQLYQKGEMRLEIAYSGTDVELAKDWQRQLADAFPGHTFDMSPLSLSVSCHIGPGALAIACARKVNRVK